MSVNQSYVGRVVDVPDVFEVGREHIRAFAEATGNTSALHVDPAVARAAGYRDVIAPPTYLAVLGTRFIEHAPLLDPDFGIDLRRIVHGMQQIELHRPVHPGDRLCVRWSIESVEVRGENEIVVTREEVADEAGAPVATLRSEWVSRGTA